MGKMIRLKEVVGEYSHEKGIHNSYNWYRQHAQKYGNITIGVTNIPVHKERELGSLNLTDFEHAVRSFIDKKAEDEKNIRFRTIKIPSRSPCKSLVFLP